MAGWIIHPANSYGVIEMGLADWLFKLYLWFKKIWDNLDEETKRKIIEAIIKSFEPILKKYYWHEKSSEDKK